MRELALQQRVVRVILEPELARHRERFAQGGLAAQQVAAGRARRAQAHREHERAVERLGVIRELDLPRAFERRARGIELSLPLLNLTERGQRRGDLFVLSAAGLDEKIERGTRLSLRAVELAQAEQRLTEPAVRSREAHGRGLARSLEQLQPAPCFALRGRIGRDLAVRVREYEVQEPFDARLAGEFHAQALRSTVEQLAQQRCIAAARDGGAGAFDDALEQVGDLRALFEFVLRSALGGLR